jgi:hypothetical protein
MNTWGGRSQTTSLQQSLTAALIRTFNAIKGNQEYPVFVQPHL